MANRFKAHGSNAMSTDEHLVASAAHCTAWRHRFIQHLPRQKAGYGNDRERKTWKAMKPASHSLWKSLWDSHILRRLPSVIDLAHSKRSDSVVLGMDFPEGTCVINIFIDRRVCGKNRCITQLTVGCFGSWQTGRKAPHTALGFGRNRRIYG